MVQQHFIMLHRATLPRQLKRCCVSMKWKMCETTTDKPRWCGQQEKVCESSFQEQGRAGQGRAGQGRAEPGRAGQGRAGQGTAEPGRTKQSRAKQCSICGQIKSPPVSLKRNVACPFCPRRCRQGPGDNDTSPAGCACDEQDRRDGSAFGRLFWSCELCGTVTPIWCMCEHSRHIELYATVWSLWEGTCWGREHFDQT